MKPHNRLPLSDDEILVSPLFYIFRPRSDKVVCTLRAKDGFPQNTAAQNAYSGTRRNSSIHCLKAAHYPRLSQLFRSKVYLPRGRMSMASRAHTHEPVRLRKKKNVLMNHFHEYIRYCCVETRQRLSAKALVRHFSNFIGVRTLRRLLVTMPMQ